MDVAATPALRIGAAALAVLILLWHPVPSINDDVAQAAGLWALSHGNLSLRVADLPEGFDPFTTNLYRHFSFGTDDNATVIPYGSTPLNILALPPLFALKIVSVMGTLPALALAAAGIFAACAWIAMGDHPWKKRVALGSVILLAGAFQSRLPASPTLEFASLQLVSMVATAASAAILWSLVRPHVQARSAGWVALGVIATTPMLFWSQMAKYHALATFLSLAALWLYRQGHRTPPLRSAAAFAVAGLAVWNFMPFGVLTLLALLVLLAPVLSQGAKEAGKRLGAIAGLGALGLIPLIIHRVLTKGQNQFLPELGTGGSLSYLFDPESKVGWLAHTTFTQPLHTFEAFARFLLWPDIMQSGIPLPFLATAPWAVPAILASRNTQLPRPVRVFAWGYIAWQIVLFGSQTDARTASADFRYHLAWWPLLALLAAPKLDSILTQDAPKWYATFTTTTTSLSLTIMLLYHRAIGWMFPYGITYELTALQRHAGLATSVVLIALHIARRPLGHMFVLALACASTTQLIVLLNNTRWNVPHVAWFLEAIAKAVSWLTTTL